jgi:hypothetical protein
MTHVIRFPRQKTSFWANAGIPTAKILPAVPGIRHLAVTLYDRRHRSPRAAALQ